MSMRLAVWLAAGIVAVGTVVSAEVMPEADPANARTTCERIVPGIHRGTERAERALARLQRLYGPLDYRGEGIWLDQYGRVLGYAETEDGDICLVARP